MTGVAGILYVYNLPAVTRGKQATRAEAPTGLIAAGKNMHLSQHSRENCNFYSGWFAINALTEHEHAKSDEFRTLQRIDIIRLGEGHSSEYIVVVEAL